ncbi:PAS domain-containing protein [Lactobacillus sp. DCY120]|uniref:PAS domain-containing protein n=1 Tax=Bombilactobacillus apium TaxID=2675299 RepID=A0A850R0Y6_9LACO|nr:NAD(P)H-dependent oxidoreductase [Bombilactobacillus apium]NVY96020.1 PAS domain-containing protein [Bombilactobacillus apium]
MKLVAIAGSIGEKSYNRLLVEFIARHFQDQVEVELLDINSVPMFNEDLESASFPIIQTLNQKIRAAAGVILATPEHNHTVPAAMKNVIEWLSYQCHPFNNKPVWIIGASYYNQGSSRAQLHLKQILESPGVNAVVMPGHEFLLSEAQEAFDEEGNLKDPKTVQFLASVLQHFTKFVQVIEMLAIPNPQSYQEEDLTSQENIDTTITDVDKEDPEWLEKAAAKVQAVEGDTYVKLDRGLLTVNQLNYFFKTMPVELTYADDNNQFLYYNHTDEAPDMLASRTPGQVGNPLSAVHPPKAVEYVKQVIYNLRKGKSDLVSMPVPGNGPDRHIMHYYKAMHDENGRYRGVNEWVVDIMPLIKYYLAATQQQLVPDPRAQTISPITGLDAVTSASQAAAPKAQPATSPEAEPEVDATSGASQHD